MKHFLFTLLSTLICSIAFCQRNAIFLNPDGDITDYETYYSFVISGEYKSEYNRKTKIRSLILYPPEELKKELEKTRKKTVLFKKLGDNFPDIIVKDIKGKTYDFTSLKGKEVVLNFWFIGCAPCEMERPELNAIYSKYKDNADVIFLSFAKNTKNQLEKFLLKRPFSYPVVELNNGLIELLDLNYGYPQNQIVGKDGTYVFNSRAAGIGSGIIIKEAIEKALSD